MTKVIRGGTIFVLAAVLALSLFLSVRPIFTNAATEDVTQDGKYVGRTFNADYDKMLEDFSSTVPSGADANYFSDGVLSVTYDGDVNSNTMDNAIYKIASGTASDTNAWPYDILVIEMSSPAGDASLEDMALYLRDITDTVYGTEEGVPTAIDLTEMLSVLSDADEIGTGKTKIALDMRTYLNDYAPDSAILAKGVTGYHLVAKAGATGTVWIHDVYLTNIDGTTSEIPDFNAAGTKTLADFENGTRVDQQVEGAGIYWCGSEVGKVIPKHVVLQDSSYTFAAGVAGFENVAVTVCGSGTLTVKVGDSSKAWSELKGPDGNAVPAVTSDYATYVINLEASGLGTSDQALTLSAAGSIDVMNAFLTNMEIKDSEIRQIPFIDAETAVRVDDFTYGSSVHDNYDDAVADESNSDAGVQYRLSYNNAAMLSISGGNLVIDATNLDSNNYINFKTQSVKNIDGLDYFVLKVKGEDGASLSGFRFGLGKDGTATPIVWGNGGLLSAEGLPIPQLGENNPYTTDDGYCYIVVDIAASGLTCGNTVDLYYSGTGKLYIDEMFFCNALDRGQQMTANPIVTDETAISQTDYQYVTAIGEGTSKIGGRYLTFEAKVEGGATLDGLRFAFDGITASNLWIGQNAEGTAVGTDGNLLPAATEEYQTFIIDLEKSGIDDWANITKIHLHATVAQGTVTVKNIGFATHKIVEENTIYQADIAESDYAIAEGGYVYVAGFEIKGNTAYNRYLAITMKGTDGIMNDELRFEFVGGDANYGTFYWKDNASLLVDPDGAALKDITGEYTTFYIDLDALGISRNFTTLHIHSTGNTAATLSVKSIGFATTDAYKYSDIEMPVFDSVKPTVTIDTADAANAGDTINVEYTVSDNVTAEENLIVSVEVTKDGMPVELTDNAFTAEEGTYVITVTVTDEEGNSNSASKTVTVTKASGGDTEPGPSDTDDPNETGCGGSVAVGTMFGAGALLAGAAVLAVALRKKRN